MYIIDRIEENKIAICEKYDSGEIIQIDATKIPKKVKEGDILEYNDGLYRINTEKTNERKNRIAEKMKYLRK